MIAFIIVAVFISGLMIGRTPEYLGKKIEAYDVKMAALIGLVTGFPLALVALGMGVVAGGLMAVLLLALRIKKRKETIPFGPFLSVATIVTLLWGNQILAWYLSFY